MLGVVDGPANQPTAAGERSVSGRLPPAVIQGVVRQNFSAMRTCYERGLAKVPTLQGRVAVRFVIQVDGTVAGAESAGADLPDAEAVACIVQVFSQLRFPAPEAGVVTVVYPIMFTPSTSP